MFKVACDKARKFTRSVVLSHRRVDGVCGSGLGAFVVVNKDGWIVTALHILQGIDELNASCEAYRGYLSEKERIEKDTTLTSKQRKRRRAQLNHPAAHSARDCSIWWAKSGIALKDISGIQIADLAVGRLEPFSPSELGITEFPVFKDPEKGLAAGTSLCKHGFPFHSIQPEFDEANNKFMLPKGSVPAPLFAIEGILSRTITTLGGPALPFPVKFLETSSPGLRGQSGGPITDSQGTIWAIQSMTVHYPLGFSPPVPNGRPNEKEHQFLNVGRGVHAETVVGFLRDRGIDFQLSQY